MSCVFANLFPFLLCFHLSIYLLGACVCPHTTLVTPFSTCNNGKEKKNHITQICIHVSKKAFNLQSCLDAIQGISKYIRLYYACFNFTSQKLEHGPKIFAKYR